MSDSDSSSSKKKKRQKKKVTRTYNIIAEERGKADNAGEYEQDFGLVETVFCFLITDFIHPYWEFWLRSEPTFGGLVHYKDKGWKEDNENDESFWKGRVVRPTHLIQNTALYSDTLVLAELKLYQVAYSRYPIAKHFFFLSGDSFPMRSPGYIKGFISHHMNLRRPQHPQHPYISIVKLFARDPTYTCQALFEMKESLQFKLLNISQVSYLLETRDREGSILHALLNGRYPMTNVVDESKGVPAPDETYIQTALFHRGLLSDNMNMNKQICGFNGEFHAKVLDCNDLHNWFRDMLSDKPDTFFFVRKVLIVHLPVNLKDLYAMKWGDEYAATERKREEGGGRRGRRTTTKKRKVKL